MAFFKGCIDSQAPVHSSDLQGRSQLCRQADAGGNHSYSQEIYPEAVFAVLGRAQVEQDPRCQELCELNASMIVSYRKQEWDKALDLINRCREPANRLNVAGLYDMYVERIASYRADPPPADWDGVYEAESK